MYTKPPSARRDSSLDARFSSRLRVLFDVWSVLKMNHPYAEFAVLYYYMRNFCNLIGLEQWYFSLI